MMKKLILRGDLVVLAIVRLSSETDDIGSVRCRLSWEATGIGAIASETDLIASDLDQFRTEVRALAGCMQGTANLVSVCGDFTVTVERAGLQTKVLGEIPLPKNTGQLSFRFETDPGWLTRV